MNSNRMNRNPEMAPALTEPVNHRQTKNSSPAQASSPHPIISDINEPTQTTSNPHHRLPAQTNGGVSSIDSLLMSKETNQSGKFRIICDRYVRFPKLSAFFSLCSSD